MTYDALHDVFLEAGSPRLGLWCGHCSLPSAVQVPLVAVSPMGAHIRSGVWLCTVCDRMVTVKV